MKSKFKYRILIKFSDEVDNNTQEMYVENRIKKAIKEYLNKSIRLLYPSIGSGKDDEDIIRNTTSVMISFEPYRIPRAFVKPLKRLLKV